MKFFPLLLLLMLLLTAGTSQASQKYFALVPPNLDYRELGNEHPAPRAMIPVYEALRNGVSDHARQILAQDQILLIRESSTPHQSNQDNITRFYKMTDAERQSWLDASGLHGLAWLDLADDFKDRLGSCKGRSCKVDYHFFVQLSNGVLVRSSDSFQLRDEARRLSREALVAISTQVEATLNSIWNSCADGEVELLAEFCSGHEKKLVGQAVVELELSRIEVDPVSEN